MSKGNPIVKARIPAQLLEQLLNSVARCNLNRQSEPYTVSSWIVAAIRERLAKHKRSNRGGRKKRGGVDGQMSGNECPTGPAGKT